METDRVRNNRIAIIFDTNFILSCLKFGIDFGELDFLIGRSYDILIPEAVIYELKNIKLNREDSVLREIALKIIEKYSVLELKGDVDKAIISFAEKNRCVVCTNDKKLRQNLRKKGTPVVFIRNRKYLEIDGSLI